MGHVDKQFRPATAGNFGKPAVGISRGYALAPATIIFGLCSRANASIWSKSMRCVSGPHAVADEVVQAGPSYSASFHG